MPGDLAGITFPKSLGVLRNSVNVHNHEGEVQPRLRARSGHPRKAFSSIVALMIRAPAPSDRSRVCSRDGQTAACAITTRMM